MGKLTGSLYQQASLPGHQHHRLVGRVVLFNWETVGRWQHRHYCE